MSTETPTLIGTECILESRNGDAVGKVVRETATQYIVRQTIPPAQTFGGDRYSKKNLKLIGAQSIWDSWRISFEDVPGRKALLVEAMRKRVVVACFRDTEWSRLSLAKLLQIKGIIERPEA